MTGDEKEIGSKARIAVEVIIENYIK